MANLYNTILLRGYLDLARRYDEARAAAIVYPGYLIERTAAGKVQPHSVRGGRAARHFAIEDAMAGPLVQPVSPAYTQGNTINDPYPVDSLVRFLNLNRGVHLQAVLKAGENVAVHDLLTSGGDGTLVKAASAVLSNAVAASTAVSNTVTETTFSNGTATIPANSLKVGDSIRVFAQGIATATNSTDTLTIKLKLGSTVVVTLPATDVANNDIFTIDATIVVRTIGATGTVVASGTYTIGAPGTATARTFNLASTVVDTTAALMVTTTATWSVANAGNSVRQDVFTAEQVNTGSNVSNAASGMDIIGEVVAALDLSASTVNDFVIVELF